MPRFLIILICLGALGTVAGVGSYAAFSDNTSRGSNSFEGGTVTLSSNSAATPIYSLTSRSPGDIGERCVRITYSGSLASTVRLYRGSFSGGTGLESYITLTVTRGTGTQTDCSDFSSAASVYSGTLAAFPSTYAGGLALTNAGGSGTWSQNDAVTYRVTATLQNNTAAQGLATGTHSFTWEARNQ
jgi:hypothetical protein